MKCSKHQENCKTSAEYKWKTWIRGEITTLLDGCLNFAEESNPSKLIYWKTNPGRLRQPITEFEMESQTNLGKTLPSGDKKLQNLAMQREIPGDARVKAPAAAAGKGLLAPPRGRGVCGQPARAPETAASPAPRSRGLPGDSFPSLRSSPSSPAPLGGGCQDRPQKVVSPAVSGKWRSSRSCGALLLGHFWAALYHSPNEVSAIVAFFVSALVIVTCCTRKGVFLVWHPSASPLADTHRASALSLPLPPFGSTRPPTPLSAAFSA